MRDADFKRLQTTNNNNAATTREEFNSFPYLLRLLNKILFVPELLCDIFCFELHFTIFRTQLPSVEFFSSSPSKCNFAETIYHWTNLLLFSVFSFSDVRQINLCLLSSLLIWTQVPQWGRRGYGCRWRAWGFNREATETEMLLFDFWFNFNWSAASSSRRIIERVRRRFQHPVFSWIRSSQFAWHNFSDAKNSNCFVCALI